MTIDMKIEKNRNEEVLEILNDPQYCKFYDIDYFNVTEKDVSKLHKILYENKKIYKT